MIDKRIFTMALELQLSEWPKSSQVNSPIVAHVGASAYARNPDDVS